MKSRKKPRKSDGAMFNTWQIDVMGFANFYIENELISKKTRFTVHFTSDLKETFSISDDSGNLQFAIPFEKVDELIEVARKEHLKAHGKN